MAAHLRYRFGSALVDRVRQFLHSRYIFIFVNQNPAEFSTFTTARAFGNYHSRTAFGPFPVIGCLPVGDVAVQRRIMGTAWRHDDSVFNFDISDLPRFKKLGKFWHSKSSSKRLLDWLILCYKNRYNAINSSYLGS